MPTPTPIPPAASITLPLSPESKQAYQDLYDKFEAEIENTTDPIALDTLNDSREQVEQILDDDDTYTLDHDTQLYADLLDQINQTNAGLTTLKTQIAAVASHIATAADIIAAIDKVLTTVAPV